MHNIQESLSLEHIQKALSDLTRILETETTLLQNNDLEATKAFDAEKYALTETLEKFHWILLNKPEVIDALPQDERSVLKHQTISMNRAMDQYHLELTRMQRVQNIVVQILRSAIEQFASPAIAYVKNGIARDTRYNERFTPPIQLNRCI